MAFGPRRLARGHPRAFPCPGAGLRSRRPPLAQVPAGGPHSDRRMAMTTADMPAIEPGSSSEATLDISAHGARGAGLKVVLPLGFDAIIGRADAATVQIHDPEVSWRHARLVHDERGVMLADLDSTNGTRINGDRITGPSLLQDGDVVSFGAVNASLPVSRARRSASQRPHRRLAPMTAGRARSLGRSRPKCRSVSRGLSRGRRRSASLPAFRRHPAPARAQR